MLVSKTSQNNSYRSKNINDCAQSNSINPKFLTCNSPVSFGALFDVFQHSRIKKIESVMSLIKSDELKGIKAFSILETFLHENNLVATLDGSRKKYKAKPYYMLRVDEVGSFQNIMHGYGNTPEDSVCNMIMILSEWKENGFCLKNYNSNKKINIPEFDKKDLFELEFFLRKEFERFKNK